jgi:hypothetical protein
MLESGISPSQNVGHLEKQDACSGGHFAFENAWCLFFNFFLVRYCRKIEEKKNLTMLCVRYGGLLDDGKKKGGGRGLGIKGCAYFGNGPWVFLYT